MSQRSAALPRWTAADVGDQSGRTAVITGANSGIGLEAARVLAARGALPTLRAATDPAASGGDYYGPGGALELTGYPVKVKSNARSRDVEVQRRLWAVSERLTGVSYAV